MEDNKKMIAKERGRRVRQARKAKNLTSDQLSELIHCSRNNLLMIERGERGLTLENADLIAAACDVLPDYLLLQSDYMTAKKKLEKEVLLLHQDSVMWSRFIETIACCAGYSFEKKEKWKIADIGALKELASCGFVDSEGVETIFNMYDVNDYVDDIQAYAVMRLQRMIQKKGSTEDGKHSRKKR